MFNLESAQIGREEEEKSQNYQGDLEIFTAFILVRISQEHSVPSPMGEGGNQVQG